MNTGLITQASQFSAKETMERMASLIQSKGMTIFSRIDHGENATQVGLHLRPTELIVFGNPKAGTILMQDSQVSGLDLPFKALAWEDESGKTWLTYNDPAWIAERHHLSDQSSPMVNSIKKGIEAIVEAVIKD
jgi:uncharacterized protein (DUF302 family)